MFVISLITCIAYLLFSCFVFTCTRYVENAFHLISALTEASLSQCFIHLIVCDIFNFNMYDSFVQFAAISSKLITSWYRQASRCLSFRN